MASEQEKRMHRCCFTGHRPQKLNASEDQVKNWLRERIIEAVQDGYVTFITGMAMGVDIWAGEIVAEMKKSNPNLHLIAASPYPGFERKWHPAWQQAYNRLLGNADIVRFVSKHYSRNAFQCRNEWMVNRSNLVIAYYNGEKGGTRNTIEYAERVGVKAIVSELKDHE